MYIYIYVYICIYIYVWACLLCGFLGMHSCIPDFFLNPCCCFILFRCPKVPWCTDHSRCSLYTDGHLFPDRTILTLLFAMSKGFHPCLKSYWALQSGLSYISFCMHSCLQPKKIFIFTKDMILFFSTFIALLAKSLVYFLIRHRGPKLFTLT